MCGLQSQSLQSFLLNKSNRIDPAEAPKCRTLPFPRKQSCPGICALINISQFIGKYCLVCCKAVKSWFWFSFQLWRRAEFKIGIFGRAVLVKWLTKILFPASISSFQYLASSKCGQYVDIGILASDLQKTYRWANICLLISCVKM